MSSRNRTHAMIGNDTARSECSYPEPYLKEIRGERARLGELLRRRELPARKVLLVGGAGYIGSVLTGSLLECGYNVRCFDLLLYDNHSCVLPYLVNPKYEFIRGDLVDKAALDQALDGVTDVVLLAGLVGDPITKRYPEASKRINNDGMVSAINLLNGKGLNKVVFISTCSNYGLIGSNDSASEDHELNPLSLYAEAKVTIEKELLRLRGKVDYYPTILRFATAFGVSPRMRFDLTVSEFTREMYLGRELLVYDAETWRPYCHVKDFSRVIRSVLDAPVERVSFEVFNAGGEVNNSSKQMIVDEITKHIQDASVKYKKHGSDPRNYKVDFTKIRKRLYFEPHYTVSDGVGELISVLQQGLFELVDENKNVYGNYEIDYKV